MSLLSGAGKKARSAGSGLRGIGNILRVYGREMGGRSLQFVAPAAIMLAMPDMLIATAKYALADSLMQMPLVISTDRPSYYDSDCVLMELSGDPRKEYVAGVADSEWDIVAEGMVETDDFGRWGDRLFCFDPQLDKPGDYRVFASDGERVEIKDIEYAASGF